MDFDNVANLRAEKMYLPSCVSVSYLQVFDTVILHFSAFLLLHFFRVGWVLEGCTIA